MMKRRKLNDNDQIHKNVKIPNYQKIFIKFK